MMIRIACAVLTSILVTAASAATHAMVGPDPLVGNYSGCRLVGPISAADVAPLRRNLQAGCYVLHVSSDGGSVVAALEMGRLIRRHTVTVSVIEGASCASSCVFLYAGGVERIARGPIQIHRPYLPTGERSFDETQRLFVKNGAAIRAFLSEMNVSERLYQMMVDVAPERVRSLTLEEMDSVGMPYRDPVYQDFVDNNSAKHLGMSKPDFLRWKAEAVAHCGDVGAIMAPEHAAGIIACWSKNYPKYFKGQ